MMKPQHGASGGGQGRRTPFLTSYALALAFINFVSVLYLKDFSSTLHQPFLHHPPPHHPRPHLHVGMGGKVGPVVEKKAAAATEEEEGSRSAAVLSLPFVVGRAAAGCDVARGEWVYDGAARPLYQEECPCIQPQLTCKAHGRPDTAYRPVRSMVEARWWRIWCLPPMGSAGLAGSASWERPWSSSGERWEALEWLHSIGCSP